MDNLHYACPISETSLTYKSRSTISLVSLTSSSCGYSHNKISIDVPPGVAAVPNLVALCVRPIGGRRDISSNAKLREFISWLGTYAILYR